MMYRWTFCETNQFGCLQVKDEYESAGSSSNTMKKRNDSAPNSAGTIALHSVKLPSRTLSISLIAPLVSKLPGTLQGRILKVASQVSDSSDSLSQLISR